MSSSRNVSLRIDNDDADYNDDKDEEAAGQKLGRTNSSCSSKGIKESCSSSKGIRISKLPINIRSSIEELNLNSNGKKSVGSSDFIMVVDDLKTTKRDNKFLRNAIVGLSIFAVLLIGCIFGASIAAARLAKDTDVDPITGIAYAIKGGSGNRAVVLKTEEVIIFNEETDIISKTNDELRVLKEIILGNGSVKFKIQGYGRSSDETTLRFIVDGGSLLYDSDGIISATGLAELILDSAFPTTTTTTVEEEENQEGGGRRYLNSGCNADAVYGSGASNCNRGEEC